MRERETTSKTELRFNCHVEASLFIYSCLCFFCVLLCGSTAVDEDWRV